MKEKLSSIFAIPMAPKTSYVTFRILLTPTLISTVIFGISCLASFLLTREGQHNFRVGFPYKFYEQFRLHRGDVNNFGWDVPSLLFDAITLWLLTLSGYFYWVINFYKPRK